MFWGRDMVSIAPVSVVLCLLPSGCNNHLSLLSGYFRVTPTLSESPAGKASDQTC